MHCSASAVQKKPVCDQQTGEICIKEIMEVVYTFDHRFGDAGMADQSFQCLGAYIEDPENFDETKFKDKISAHELEEIAA